MTRRYTGFPESVKAIVDERSSGCCERCSRRSWDMQYHHRRARGMGGTRQPGTNSASNCLYLCGDCHRYVESNRTEALGAGWLVRQDDNPVVVPVIVRGRGVWLDSDGSIKPLSEAVS